MDQISSHSKSKMCTKHSQQEIKFVQVNDLSNSSDSNHLFSCNTCIHSDLALKEKNYLLIKQIIDEGQTNILQKWPPINDYSILDKLIQHIEEESSSSLVVHQIKNYFTQFKEEFLRKVDLCERKMINRALKLPFAKESVLKQYQDISQINKLRSILIEGEQMSDEATKQIYSQFIQEISQKKKQNSELLANLLEQCKQTDSLVDFEFPNQMKDSIISLVDKIDFFSFSNVVIQNINQQTKSEVTEILQASKGLENDDLTKKQVINEQPIQIKLKETNWKEGIYLIYIEEGNQVSLREQNDYILNTVSNLILEKDKKYIFRFQIECPNDSWFAIGLMENSKCDLDFGLNNNLCCTFYKSNNQIQYEGGNGIDTHLKGDKLKLSQENNMVEMRVWRAGYQLEMLDYPHYQYKVGLKEEHKHKLIEMNDLTIYIGIYLIGMKITLTSAVTVDAFPN